jgi:hypothetical protein
MKSPWVSLYIGRRALCVGTSWRLFEGKGNDLAVSQTINTSPEIWAPAFQISTNNTNDDNSCRESDIVQLSSSGAAVINRGSCHHPVQLSSSGATAINRCSCHHPVQTSSSGAAAIFRCNCHQPVQLSSSGAAVIIRSNCHQAVQLSSSGAAVIIRCNCHQLVQLSSSGAAVIIRPILLYNFQSPMCHTQISNITNISSVFLLCSTVSSHDLLSYRCFGEKILIEGCRVGFKTCLWLCSYCVLI